MDAREEDQPGDRSFDDRRRFLRRASRGIVGAAVVGGAASSDLHAREHREAIPREGERPQAGGPVTSIRDFGAVGDGETDDTDAFRAAVAAAPGGIFLPKGRYVLTGSVEVNLDEVGPLSMYGDGTATLVMAGSGPALHFVGTHDGTANPATVDTAVWQRQRMPLIDGFEVVGAHEQAVGLRLEGTMQAIVSRLAVRQLHHGIHLVRRNRNVIISEAQIYENRGVGIYLDEVNLHQINVSNSHISYNREGGIVVRSSEVRNLQIGTCDIEGNMAAEGPETANVFIDVREGMMREGAISGCTIQHSSDAPKSANVRFLGRKPPIKAGRFSIADNAMSDAVYNIHLVDSRGITITGNTFWMGTDYQLLAEGSSHVILSANLFEENSDYGGRSADSNGIEFRDCEYCTLSDLHVEQSVDRAVYVSIRNSRSFNISNSFVDGFENTGILLENSSACRVTDCTIRPAEQATGTATAVDVRGGQGNMIVDNIVGAPVEAPSGTAVVRGNQQ
jgi:hypothetical protein